MVIGGCVTFRNFWSLQPENAVVLILKPYVTAILECHIDSILFLVFVVFNLQLQANLIEGSLQFSQSLILILVLNFNVSLFTSMHVK